MSGQKVLIVCTSSSEMAGHPTGLWLEEVAAPYYLFKAAGLEVTMASVKGGAVPIDSDSMAEAFFTEPAKKFMHDPVAIGAFAHTTAIADIVAAGPVDATYAAIFLPGGHGTCGHGDIHDNIGVKTAVEQMFNAGKIVAAVCHGPSGLNQCVKASGEPLVKGLKVAAFNNSEEKAVQLDGKVPYSLEDKMKEQGAEYVPGGDWSVNAVRDQNLITGQNPQSSEKVGELIVEALK